MSSEFDEARAAFLEAENAQLHARVRELEDRVLRETVPPPSAHDRPTGPDVNHIHDKISDEANRLARAVTFAFLEQLRSAADVLKSVADETFRREEERANRSAAADAPPSRIAMQRLAEFPSDLASIIAKGTEGTLGASRRVAETFRETYNERVPK